jgi:hypothetical protein
MPEEPSIQDLSPVVPKGVDKEPLAVIDTSGSMTWPAAEGSPIERRSVVGEAMGKLVAKLEVEDAQAAKELEAEMATGGEGEAGGLMTVLFADADNARVLGDLNDANWQEKWGSIAWGGGTFIMPGWQLAVDNYMEEFGDTPKQDRPALLALVITDGEAKDMAEFEAECAKTTGGTYICVAIIGFGPEHDATLAAYQKLADANKHVRVVTFGSETDPDVIAEGLISLVS